MLIMGLTYKENVPDTRESPVREMVKELKEFGVDVYGYDPLLSEEAIEAFGVNALDDILQVTDHTLLPEGRILPPAGRPIADCMDCVIVAVAHNKFKRMNSKDFLLAQTFLSNFRKV